MKAPGFTPGFIRQYFQAVVMEHHPCDLEPVKPGLLGDTLRGLGYPNSLWPAHHQNGWQCDVCIIPVRSQATQVSFSQSGSMRAQVSPLARTTIARLRAG